jgi:hypothetical protein
LIDANFLLTNNYPSSIIAVVMKSSRDHFRIGDLQLRILKELWACAEASVAEVHATVGSERSLAHTTIATMLRKMEERGLVGHREEGPHLSIVLPSGPKMSTTARRGIFWSDCLKAAWRAP